MCGGDPAALPPAVDPKVEREQAASDATAAANESSAAARRLRKQQSLLASGAVNTNAQTSTVLATGKDKLGS